MSHYFSEAEHQNSEQREKELLAKLAPFIEYAKANSPYYAQHLNAINAGDINSRTALASIAITRKSQLIKLQKAKPFFAGMVAKQAKVDRIYQSPGPINEPENASDDWWRLAQAFYAAGFRAGDIVQNCLSYHLTPGGFILDSGARACGCTVIPAGPGQTDQQLEVIKQLQPVGYCGTPSFLKILLDKAKTQGVDVSCLKKALVTGEAFTNALKAEFEALNIKAYQAYATADIGLIGYESEGSDGFIVAEDILLEIVKPGSQQPVAPGEVGEVVVTSFNKDYPLIRFATGDLSAIATGTSQCGRTNMRIKGWLGRADQTAKIKGMFVHPEQIDNVMNVHRQIIKSRLVINHKNHNDTMVFQCEVDTANTTDSDTVKLINVIKESLKKATNLSGDVQLVAVGSLANDGKIIDDQRSV